MKLKIILFIVGSFLVFNAFAQKKVAQNTDNLNSSINSNGSKIIRVTDSNTLIAKIELEGANYDQVNNGLPYFVVKKISTGTIGFKPQITNVVTQPVTNEQEVVIKKHFGKLLLNNVELIDISGVAKNEIINAYKYVPFIYVNDKIEEVIELEIKWNQVTSAFKPSRSVNSFTNTSILATGNWYKLGTPKTGVYKLDKNFLTAVGIDIATLDPKKIRIYGNGGKMLPELNSAFRLDDLHENAIEVVGESDGTFDNNDYVLFYATGTDEWQYNKNSKLKYKVKTNLYADTSYYFLNVDLGNGKRIVNTATNLAAPTRTTSAYDFLAFEEKNEVNFVKSGKNFYGQYFDIINSYSFNWDDGNFVVGDTINCEATVAARHFDVTNINFSGNGLNFATINGGTDINNYLGNFVTIATSNSKALNNNANNITITSTKTTPNAIAWLDKITVNARRGLNVNQKQFQFRDERVISSGNTALYNLALNTSQALKIWNVTNPIAPRNQVFAQTNNSISFIASTDSLMEYAVINPNDHYTPKFVAKIQNQNLHAIQQADYVLVAHPLFMNQAQILGELHKANEGLTYTVVSTEQIYNEFGSGKQDISAIRDFIRMLYSRNIVAKKEVKYVALLGDGSYNMRNRSLQTNSCFIPSYQSSESIGILNSLITDDFYGLMDPTEGTAAAEGNGYIDIGVGRLMARTTTEMNGIIKKIQNYYKKDAQFQVNETPQNCSASGTSNFGEWRNWVMFLADDEDRALHMEQSDRLARKLKQNFPLFNQDKIFLDAYQQFSTPGGQRYPDAKSDFDRRIERGCLIMNYTGHGGEVGLTGERIIDIPTINNWNNSDKLPLFVTATCEFSRFDDPDRTSAGELCLLNPNGGAIGMLTTVRIAYAETNETLNNKIFDFGFKRLPNGKMPALGDIIQETKASLDQSMVYANFHLLGDPALVLAYPQMKVITKSINNVNVTNTSSDTLTALSKITISGFVADTMGVKLSNFNGIIYPTVFDKIQDISCLINDAGSYYPAFAGPFRYKLQKNVLYKGKVKVTNGEFKFTFIVPKDISFSAGDGRISYYATNGNIDAGGEYKNIIIGGKTNPNPIVDNDGPQSKLYLNDINFVNGGIANENPILIANLTDSSGINTLGTAIGHDITAVLDGNTSKPYVLNDFYETNLDSYQSGRVRYQFNNLTPGEHKLEFKSWDILNNSNTAQLDFVVAESAELALKQVLNYPNPFTTLTKFTFEHNQACAPLKVTIQIYTITGKIVKTIQQYAYCEGYRPSGIAWDGRDDFGDKIGKGVYIYKLSIQNNENKKAEKTEKLVILN